MVKADKFTVPHLVCDAIKRYLSENQDGGTGVLDWKKVSKLVKEGSELDVSAEQCKQVWSQITSDGPSQSSKKRKASSEAEEDSFGVVHLTPGSLEETAGKLSWQNDDKGQGEAICTNGAAILEPLQFNLPRDHDMMAFTTFQKEQKDASAHVSVTSGTLLGVCYGAALCSSRHARPLTHRAYTMKGNSEDVLVKRQYKKKSAMSEEAA